MTYLGLGGNKFTKIAKELFSGLSSLTKLYLYDNWISSIEDGAFSELAALTILSLHDNKLTVLQRKLFTGLTAMTSLSLYNNQISIVENGAFSELSTLTYLELNGNKLAVLQGKLFSGLLGLTGLELNNNQIASIEDDAFSELASLTLLGLDGNKLTVLQGQLFTGLTAMTDLSLQDNQISSIEGSTFSELSALKLLRLDGNKLTTLHETMLAGLKAITELYLYDNQISIIENDAFSELSALKLLRLDGNSLTVLQGKLLSGLTAITELDLFDNQIATIEDGAFSGLLAMALLRLDGNKLTVLQGQLFTGLTAMTDLSLQDNQISSIEGSTFSELSALKLLRLDGNKLTTLHEMPFTGLTAMTSLYLYDNQISIIENDAFSELSALKLLRLDGNSLTVLQGKQFTGLTAITELDLFDNQIATIEDGAFSGLLAMAFLRLDGNKLTVLQGQLFTGLTAMTDLSLQDNQISSIGDGAFSWLTALLELYLHDNRLVELNPTLFSNLNNLKYLDLSKNKLTAIDSPTFRPIASSLKKLYLAENTISEVGLVLQEMRQQRNLKVLTMEGNPSNCHVTSITNQNQNGTVVCTCADGFGQISFDDATIRTRSINSTTSHSNVDRTDGYLCQSPARAVIIPQTVGTLRSRFLLVGPVEQLAEPSSATQSLTFDGDSSFKWNGYDISANGITVDLCWSSKSKAEFNWTCLPTGLFGCTNGSLGDITHPPGSPTDNRFFAYDYPTTFEINYNVNTTSATDVSPTSANQSTTIKMAYSAFHWPARFDTAFKADTENGITTKLVAGSNLTSPRSLWINQTVTAQPSTSTTKHEIFNNTANISATVDANPFIPTSIIFKLANNTCKTKHSANILDVRTITSKVTDRINGTVDHDDGSQTLASTSTTVVVGWEVVVGDPTDIRKATNLSQGNTMKPCTAVLQAHDLVTTEILNITTIEASVQDCWDNGNPLNLTNIQHLSCGGRGECNPDLDLYDGDFKGCNCKNGYGGRRCDVTLQLCNETNHERFNVDVGECKAFKPKVQLKSRDGAILGHELYTTTEELKTHVFVEGTTVRIQGVVLNETASKFSSGDANDVRYLLSKNAEHSFFVSGPTGEIAAYLTFPVTSTEDVHSYNFALIAEDKLGAKFTVRSMTIHVKRKPPAVLPAILVCTMVTILIGFVAHKLRQRHLAKKDAIAALARAMKAYGLEDLETTHAYIGSGGGGMSINSGDLVGVTMTTITNAAFVGLDEETSSDADVVLLLEPPTNSSNNGTIVGYNNDPATYDDDADNNSNGDIITGANAGVQANATSALPFKQSKTLKKPKNASQNRQQLSKFVAPTISLGKSTLAAKGLDVLLGVDPKTYMHVKNKVKVMLKEFAKNGTPNDIKNLKSLIDGTYELPPNKDGSPLKPEDVRVLESS
eukprot:gene4968-2881_t